MTHDRIDALVSDITASLRIEQLPHIADAILLTADDVARADVLFDVTDKVPVGGRRIFFRTALPWAARALSAWSMGRDGESLRWTILAEYEMGRYHEVPVGGSDEV